jgi:hypothetical protein
LFYLLIVNSVKNALLRKTAGNGSSKTKMFNPRVKYRTMSFSSFTEFIRGGRLPLHRDNRPR